MSLSLIGIIFVQGYWINNTVENNEEQFSFNAKQNSDFGIQWDTISRV